MYGRIIEALEDNRTAPLRRTTPKNHFIATVAKPDYNVSIMIFNDSHRSVEIALTDIETGHEFCRHCFDRLDVLLSFLSQAFAPPEDEKVCERTGSDIRIIEHKEQ